MKPFQSDITAFFGQAAKQTAVAADANPNNPVAVPVNSAAAAPVDPAAAAASVRPAAPVNPAANAPVRPAPAAPVHPTSVARSCQSLPASPAKKFGQFLKKYGPFYGLFKATFGAYL
jgi:hypothetical protein